MSKSFSVDRLLNSVVKQLDLKNPNAVKSTQLRKYVATVSQVIDLSESELDWLARHMGHDIAVHREYYRLHDSTLELAKVSKLLLAVEEGHTSKWQGKKLCEIHLDELPLENETDDNSCDDKDNDDVSESDEDYFSKSTNAYQKKDNSLRATYENAQAKDVKCRSRRKLRWSKEEANVVLHFFSDNIRKMKVPG
eukprot:gene1366-1510_t